MNQLELEEPASEQLDRTVDTTVPITLTVNGKRHHLTVEPRVTLLDALRNCLGLTGTKKGCDEGQCGACTVLVDGRRIDSCLTLAVMNQHVEITTIEGLGTPETLHPIQKAFIKHDGFQWATARLGRSCRRLPCWNTKNPPDPTPRSVSA